jgi:hypothetical protein
LRVVEIRVKRIEHALPGKVRRKRVSDIEACYRLCAELVINLERDMVLSADGLREGVEVDVLLCG